MLTTSIKLRKKRLAINAHKYTTDRQHLVMSSTAWKRSRVTSSPESTCAKLCMYNLHIKTETSEPIKRDALNSFCLRIPIRLFTTAEESTQRIHIFSCRYVEQIFFSHLKFTCTVVKNSTKASQHLYRISSKSLAPFTGSCTRIFFVSWLKNWK